jgi:uncharacterized repeat protein (TIGR01451 family)
MDRKLLPFVRSHLTIIPLAGVLAALAILGLVMLSSAQSPPVSVEKTANPQTVPYGGHVKYTAVFSNSSASDVGLEVISDTLPPGFTFVSMGAGSAILHNPIGTTGTIVWDQGDYLVSAGTILTLAYNVRATAPYHPDPYENRVEARLSTGETIVGSTPVWVEGAWLQGVKRASLDDVRTGSPLEYTVILSNTGTDDAVLAAISDTLPAGFTFRQMISGPLPAPAVQGNELVWSGPFDIAHGDQLEFRYRVIAYGVVGQAYHNSVRAAFDGQVSDPFEASVTLLPALVHLPLVVRMEEQTVPYRFVFESRPDGGNFEIFAMNADGSDKVNVSNNDGGDLEPDWSPDGSKVVWVHYEDGKGDIYVANADGTGEVNFSNEPKDERGPAWSPDGARIAYYRRVEDGSELHWEVFWMNADDSLNKTQLTDRECQSYAPLWSPDGNKLAYLCGLDNYAEIWVMDVATRIHTRLTNNDVPDRAPAWSPDSTQLAYVRFQTSDSEIYVVDIASGVSTPLTNNTDDDYTPDWSPDGTRIAFSTYIDQSYEIAVMDVNGQNIVNLTDTDPYIGDYVPKWSPDGAMILFISNRDGNKELYVMNADGSGQSRLTFTSANESIYKWKPQ